MGGSQSTQVNIPYSVKVGETPVYRHPMCTEGLLEPVMHGCETLYDVLQ